MKIFMVCALALAFSLSVAQAAPAKHKNNAQQDKMTECNQKAVGLKGPPRKTFMKSCLAGEPVDTAKINAQQEKMKSCNADATGKKGPDRKAFMKQCLAKS